MNKRLYRLLMEYKDKELDDNFIYTGFDTIMSDADDELFRFVDDFTIDNDIDEYGTYDHNSGLITVNKDKIINEPPIKRCYNDRIYALEVIRHEIEHARNIQRLHESREDIESTVLRYALIDYCMQNGLLPCNIEESFIQLCRILKKRMNYLYNPDERIADIKAWKYMVNLLKNQRTSDDLLFARSMLFYAYRRGYEDNRYYVEAPTYTYLLNTDMFREFYLLRKRVDQKDYSLDTRLLCGLPVTYDEYDSKVLKKTRLQIRKNNGKLERE